jgi:transglutaminase-like putative cysteine protease
VFFRNTVDDDGRYTVTSRPSIASVDDLQAASATYPDWVTQRYLQLPPTVSERTVAKVESIVAGLDNAYDMARAIETYLRDTVVYDETVTEPPEGVDIVDYLLFERSRGYCEYSASAMAVMMRTLGVPARVSVGFYPGSYDESAGGFLYQQQNAHAWTEVFIPGYGWIPFEPTSSQPLIDGATGDEQPAAPEPTSAPTVSPDVPATEPSIASPAVDLTQDQAESPPLPATTQSGGPPGWLLPVAGAGLAISIVAIAAWLSWSMPLRHLTPAAALYGRIRRVGAWLGVHQLSSGTPSEYGRALADRMPGARDEVWRIVRTYEADTYGPDQQRSSTIQLAQEAWSSIRRTLPRLLVWRR